MNKAMKKTTLQQIFSRNPSTEGELKLLLSRLDASRAQQELVDMIERGVFDEMDYSLFAEVARSVGIGDQRHRLLKLVSDDETDPLARKFALAALSEGDPEELVAELGGINPTHLQEACDMPLEEMMGEIQMDPSQAKQVTELLQGSPEEMREFLLFTLGRCRREVGTPAAAAYADALACPELEPFYTPMLEAIVQEGGEEGVSLLTVLRDQAQDDDNRRRFQTALLRTGTRAIEKNAPPNTPKGTAYVGSCDGQGTFLVLGRFDVSKKNATTAYLCIRAAGDIRDGFVMPRSGEAEFQELLDAASRDAYAGFAEISLGQVAALIEDAVDRTAEQGSQLPRDATPAIKLLSSATPEHLPRLDELAADVQVSAEGLQHLFERPEYKAWFFDIGDLMGAEVEAPEENSDLERWCIAAAEKLASTPIRARVLAMLRHMSRWHQWKKESELSALCAAAADEASEHFEKSAIMRVMLEKTLEDGIVAQEMLSFLADTGGFGDVELRRALRSRFFPTLKWPKGRHMALLDLTEATYSGLLEALRYLPGERRPRDEDHYAIAFQIAKTFVSMLLNVSKTAQEMGKLEKRLAKMARFSTEEIGQILTTILPKLTSFVEDVCSVCEVDCLSRPNTKMTEAFFSDDHPVGDQWEDDLEYWNE